MTSNSVTLNCFDSEQTLIITAPSDKRILVDAGPGTGKTAVACARVSWLIDTCGVNPSHIWFISFTRTAVQEIRKRIMEYLKNPNYAYIIKIATIDSCSWTINQGFNNTGIIGNTIFPSYEENIDKVRKLLETPDIEKQIVHNIDHLIIDEAQDVIGVRAKLLLTLISKLKKRCGVTVFSDDAQSIYGFAIDEEKNDKILSISLPQSIRTFFNSDFYQCSLMKIYRTESATLFKLFTETRNDVLNKKINPKEKIKKIREFLVSSSQEIPDISEQQLVDPYNTFILYRRRAEVLTASSFFGQRPHRIRMSGTPHLIHPWVGLCLSEFISKTLKKTDFNLLWEEAISKSEKLINKKSDGHIPYFNSINFDDAWDVLCRLAGNKNSVDMVYLRQTLGSQNPPFEMVNSEIGLSGPIIGTIHASKGREAECVHLMMPNNAFKRDDPDDVINEETRVHFVGATRARKELKVGKGYCITGTHTLDSGRIYRTLNKNGGIQVEIGRSGDITADCIVGTDLFSDSAAVTKNLSALIKNAHKNKGVTGLLNKDFKKYSLCFEDSNRSFAFLSESVNSEIKSVLKLIRGNADHKLFYPGKLQYMRCFGIRTIVLPNEQECNNLHDPWAESGFILAPVIFGFSQFYVHN
ncbi:MAG TPA: UvrD-helicase domain-containing protein [Methanospirillum sp.]|uniref:UvrD-helicase domain-containing protein n=1 Tax=Methanospirillum sp. TaxID=45200 RepID=UPI002CE24A8F|nr:UvrD-helicase domain-containing protein [Methanospirillum sp.]HOJ96950.1 UvrD-helicase domain-containing protein [Methanospirillum sp.]HPP77531.1 UvrD-helicase domain-containing protein [Methanospirillum sp.]